MSNPPPRITAKPAVIARQLFKLERRGRYGEALLELGFGEADTSFAPNIEGMAEVDAAEMLLRCGSLAGFYGHYKQIPDSQINSRNLLTDARERFIELNDPSKIAECENYLALTYWRTGELNEADTWIEEALAHNLPKSTDVRLHALMTRMLINLSLKRYEENLLLGRQVEADFFAFADAYLKGGLAANLGLSYKNLGNADEAMRLLELAKHYQEQAGHATFIGTAQNNLAQLYKSAGRFREAHRAIDHAIKVFEEIEDLTREGFSYDTKALIFVAEKKYEQALATIEKGVSILKCSENASYIADSLLTKSKILLYLDDFPSAVFALLEGVDILGKNAGEEAVRHLVEQFEAAIKEKDTPKQPEIIEPSAADDLELVLPASISHYEDYQGVWINNSHLEKAGLRKNSLAVVVSDDIKRGDLVALTETESGSVSCGFYDSEFGIVCLEGIDSEPQLFDESAVKILGKIVGVGHPAKADGGKIVVEPVKL